MGLLVGVKNGTMAVLRFMWGLPARIAAWRATSPEEWAEWRRGAWKTVKHEAHHYWVGGGGGQAGPLVRASPRGGHCWWPAALAAHACLLTPVLALVVHV